MDIRLARLLQSMVAYDSGDARRCQHLLKVHDLAATIGTLEGLAAEDLFVLEAAAIIHDVGIHVSEGRSGGDSGRNQQLYGPAEGRKVMEEVGCFSPQEQDAVAFLIAHHHTYAGISSPSWQMLVEADFLVNLYENGAPAEEIRRVRERIFRTKTGLALFDAMFRDPEGQVRQGRLFSCRDGIISRPKAAVSPAG